MNESAINLPTNNLQSVATDPTHTVWVSANAGSGKTYVLSRRVIRLLLEGNKPSDLLCLTFTKAAAAEMANRVFKTLGEWAMMADSKLEEAITELTGYKPDKKRVSRARKLFAMALDTPGGLRIQTIHAFCESLLHQFPLEANIPGHFEMMDDLDQSLLLDEARRRVIMASLGIGKIPGASEKAGPSISVTADQLADAFVVLRNHASDDAIDKAIHQIVHDRENFTRWIEENGGSVRDAYSPMWQSVSLARESTEAELYETFAAENVYSKSELSELVAMARGMKSKSYKPLADTLQTIAETNDAEKKFSLRRQTYLTNSDKPRKALVHSSFLEPVPHQLELFHKEQELLQKQLDRMHTLANFRASEALFLVCEAILIEYERLKQQSGLLDFNDLIAKTANLLMRNEIANWIQYKLDKGISHVLVDEAQDTSPLQWQIIRSITSEFFAGQSASDKLRTVFIVGDEKQSIYSFQGAEPKEFNRQFHDLERQVSAAKGAFKRVPLTVSYRSTEEVLSAVDQVFSLPENARGLGIEGSLQTHSANRLTDRGEVIVWDLFIKPKRVEKTDWRDPPDELTALDAEVQLAEKIASTIKGWIDREEVLPGRDVPIRYGDILILVRKRDRFVSAMNRALKLRGLVSAGADRLKLTEHIAVEDMLALGRFASMELDELSLAGILKSPVFDFSEDELFELAHARGKTSLYECIGEKVSIGEASSKLIEAHAILKTIRKSAAELSVFEFYARIFATNNLRKKYIARLGHEVEEIIDGFFQAALHYDERTGLGLQGFVEMLSSAKPELKREINMETDEIRVITTHSSKGLEAPIVFLVDPGTKAFETKHAPPVIKYEYEKNRQTYLWQTQKEERLLATAKVYDDIEAAAEEEYRRLLYVGMTRAADRLIVCGYRSDSEKEFEHWHSMICKGLSATQLDPKLNGRFIERTDDNGISIGRYWEIENRYHREKTPIDKISTKAPERSLGLPDWVSRAKAEPSAPRPLSPSGVLQLLNIGEEPERYGTIENSLAMERGNGVHHLLQILPDIAADRRDGVITNYFKLSKAGFPPETESEIQRLVVEILDHPETSFLFGSGSKAEVEISGKIKLSNRAHLVRGKIDRLVITDDTVTIADYKTNRVVPQNATQIPADYLAQMALYRELITSLYPDKAVHCLIVWTQNAAIMAIEDELLDQQMEKLNKT